MSKSLPRDRCERDRLFEERSYRRGLVLAAVGRTGLAMSLTEMAAATGFGPGVDLDLELLAERGLVGALGAGAKRRYFPLAWIKGGQE